MPEPDPGAARPPDPGSSFGEPRSTPPTSASNPKSAFTVIWLIVGLAALLMIVIGGFFFLQSFGG